MLGLGKLGMLISMDFGHENNEEPHHDQKDDSQYWSIGDIEKATQKEKNKDNAGVDKPNSC